MRAALVLLALVMCWPARRAEACSSAPRCSRRLCTDAAGIATAHQVEPLPGEDPKRFWMALDSILRAPPGNLTFVPGARFHWHLSTPGPLVVYWRPEGYEDPTVLNEVMSVSAAGILDCGKNSTQLCPGKPGLTIEQVLALRDMPDCTDLADEAGYDFCMPGSCGPFPGCGAAPARDAAPWSSIALALAILSAVRLRRRPE